MDLISQVTLMGGACDRATLVDLRGRAEVDAALRSGVLLRTGRGRYALATSRDFVKRASMVGGVLSHRSAAQHWGWAQKSVPPRPEVTVARERRLFLGARELVLPHWSVLEPFEVDGMVTTMERTLIDCMRNLPLDESLPIVDSAVRADDVTPAALVQLADATRGRGRERIRRVSRMATGKAANAFESVCRAQAGLVPGLHVEAQHPVRVPGTSVVLHPDLADPVLKIAVECEGFEWHNGSAALTRDCRRYNLLYLLGWQVIRFSWVLVMHDPAYVHATLVSAVAQAHANVA